jgi:hypothetical protein
LATHERRHFFFKATLEKGKNIAAPLLPNPTIEDQIIGFTLKTHPTKLKAMPLRKEECVNACH